MTKHYLIKGDMLTDQGLVDSRATLAIYTDAASRWWVADYPGCLGADPIVAFATMLDGSCVHIRSGATEAEIARGYGFAWEFAPDAGELERVGMPVEALA